MLFLSYLTYAEPVIIGGKQNRTVDNLANGLYWAIVSFYLFLFSLTRFFKSTSDVLIGGVVCLWGRDVLMGGIFYWAIVSS